MIPVNFEPPWWYNYRRRKYKKQNYMDMEMIVRSSFVDTWKDYVHHCSIAGVSRLTDPKSSFFTRILWAGILSYACGIVIYYLYLTWSSTLTRPLVVTGESFMYPIKDIPFPAIALCNVNRISKRALKKCTLESYPRLAKYNITLTNLEYFYADMGRLIDFDYDSSRPYVKLMEIFSFKEFSDRTVELMKTLAPNCDEMLIRCQWAGEIVNCSSIFEVRRTVIGHCCAFNYVLDYNSADRPRGIAEARSQKIPGFNNGLRVIVDALIDDYAYPVAKRYGFEILIFDPFHYADMTGGRVIQRTVQPNQAKYFQISSTKQIASSEVRKYSLKVRKCLFRDEKSKEFRNMYSYSACIVKCRILSVQSLCQCTPYFLPTASPTEAVTCTLKHLKCLNKYKEKLQYLYPLGSEQNSEGLEQEIADSLFCEDCLPDCELTQHVTKSFSVALTQKASTNKLFRTDFTKGVNMTNRSVINIYQSTTGGTLHRLDVVAYWFEILSNFGGFCGMLMGMGIYTIVEYIYFFFLRFAQTIYNNYLKYN